MPPGDLMSRIKNVMALRHLSQRTVEAYVYWIRNFILYHQVLDIRLGSTGNIPRAIRHPRMPVVLSPRPQGVSLL